MGRPSKYNPKIAQLICDLLMEGKSLRKICSLDGMPTISTVGLWIVEDREGFLVRYRRAREVQHELFFDELNDISDDDSGDVAGELKMPNMVAVNRAKLRIDTRKWAISKILPKQ